MRISYIRKLQELGVYRKDIERLRYYQREVLKESGGKVKFSTTAKEVYENLSQGHTSIEKEIYNIKETRETIKEAEKEGIKYSFQRVNESIDMQRQLRLYAGMSVSRLTLLKFSDDDFDYLVELVKKLLTYIDPETGEVMKGGKVLQILNEIAELIFKYA